MVRVAIVSVPYPWRVVQNEEEGLVHAIRDARKREPGRSGSGRAGQGVSDASIQNPSARRESERARPGVRGRPQARARGVRAPPRAARHGADLHRLRRRRARSAPEDGGRGVRLGSPARRSRAPCAPAQVDARARRRREPPDAARLAAAGRGAHQQPGCPRPPGDRVRGDGHPHAQQPRARDGHQPAQGPLAAMLQQQHRGQDAVDRRRRPHRRRRGEMGEGDGTCT